MTEVLASLQATGFATWLRESESIWALATVLTVHTIGMAILAGSAFAFDLRVLGMARSIPLAPLRTLFRVMWTGFWINAATGVALFATDASRMGTSGTFLAKMTFVAIGVVTMVLLRRHVYDRNPAAGQVSSTARLVAVVSILAWTAAISAGRLLGYLDKF